MTASTPALTRMCEAVHQHGPWPAWSLAFTGYPAPTVTAGELPGVVQVAVRSDHPVQARAMASCRIRNGARMAPVPAYVRGQRPSASTTVYARHDLSLLFYFLDATEAPPHG